MKFVIEEMSLPKRSVRFGKDIFVHVRDHARAYFSTVITKYSIEISICDILVEQDHFWTWVEICSKETKRNVVGNVPK